MANRAIINMNSIGKKVMETQAFRKKAEEYVRAQFEKKKNGVISEFQQSPVTREILGGANSSNVSMTLGGYGNLYSYIGFYSGENPLDTIHDYLKNFKFYGRMTKKSSRGTQMFVSFVVKWYDIKEIEALSPMPWESGNSWVRGIEMGISGFSYYMHGNFANTRSGKGRQSKNKVGLAPSFTPTRYLPTIIKKAERPRR